MYWFFKHIGSLGDSLVINGLVNKWAEECDQLFYLCKTTHFHTLYELYRENPKITVMCDVQTFEQHKKVYTPSKTIQPWEYILTSLDTEQMYWLNWDRQIYEFYNELYCIRYTKFRLPSDLPDSTRLFNSLVTPGERYIVRHQFMNSLNETFVNYNIEPFNHDNLRVIDITPELSPCILDYVDLLINAEQVHLTPSSIFCLVDSIHWRIQGKKYLHLTRKDYASQYNSFLNNFCWNPITYPSHVKL